MSDADSSDSADSSGSTDPPGSGGGAFDWLSLDEDEEIVWSGNPHPMSIVPALIFGIPLAIVIIGIVIIVGAYLWRENTDYVVTTDGLYRKTGVLSRDVQKIEFEKVQNISFTQGIVGTQFGYGNVDISTAGGSGVEMQFQSVADPKSVQEEINRLIKRSRRGEEREEGPSKEQVLDEILGELRAMRETFERIERGGERTERGGERTERGGERTERGGERTERGGERTDRGDERTERGGEPTERRGATGRDPGDAPGEGGGDDGRHGSGDIDGTRSPDDRRRRDSRDR